MKYLKFFIICILASLMLVSCMSLTFDRNSLQANDYSPLANKLPNLEIKTAETTQIGATDQVSTASYIYTVFRRELEKNVIDTSNETTSGYIEMVIIYANANIDYNWFSNNVALEFEINIYNKNNQKIWCNTYSADTTIATNPRTTSPSTIAAIGYVKLEHQLLDQFKYDVAIDYASICSRLNQ